MLPDRQSLSSQDPRTHPSSSLPMSITMSSRTNDRASDVPRSLPRDNIALPGLTRLIDRALRMPC